MLTPAVLALLLCSAVVCVIAAVAAVAGVAVVMGWNPEDGGRAQLMRERRSFLVEAGLKVVLCFQLVSLFLFVATVQHLHSLFTGAMCAAGTLNANPHGYPTLAAKVAVFVLCGLWLVVHRASPSAPSVGLVRFKHLFLVVVVAALAVENVLQLRYFTGLNPEIITSCCATIFGEEARGLGSGLASLPPALSSVAFVATLAVTLTSGVVSLARGRSTWLYALLVIPLAVAAVDSVISWVAPTVYQLPTHHCPFCLLSFDYGCIGVPLYGFLALAVVAGAGSGLVSLLRSIDPLHCIRTGEERRLCCASMGGFLFFSVIAIWPTVTSNVRLWGP